MSKYDWRFCKSNEKGSIYCDDFINNAFNDDFVKSFAREIIQNSIDSRSDTTKPTKIDFCLEYINKEDVPGLETLDNTLNLCIDVITTTQQKDKFIYARNLLKDDKIPFLKVSDSNTTGTSQKAWNALVYEKGRSEKNNSGSAGSYGVGKAAAFNMSYCNTVFYSSKYYDGSKKDYDYQFIGKTSLTNFFIDDQKYSKEGWFFDDDNNQINVNDYKYINDFFTRNLKDSIGTDVIIMLPKITDRLTFQSNLVCSILDNFYVGIKQDLIQLNVRINEPIEINSDNIDDLIIKYYDKDFKKDHFLDNGITYGLLCDYANAFKNDSRIIPIPKIKNLDFKDCYLEVYYNLTPEKNKKYFCFYREHGMKIYDSKFSDAGKPFAAIFVAHGEEINKYLSTLENASHTKFVPSDSNPKKSEDDKSLLDGLKSLIENDISTQTKVAIKDEYDIEELNNLIDNNNEFTANTKIGQKKSTKKKDSNDSLIQVKKKNKVKVTWTKDNNPLSPEKKQPNDKPHITDESRPLPYNEFTNEESKNENLGIKNVEYEQMFVTIKDDYYLMKFKVDESLKDVAISLEAKNIDDNINKIENMLEFASINDKAVNIIDGNKLDIGDYKKDESLVIKIKLKRNPRYKLYGKVLGKSND